MKSNKRDYMIDELLTLLAAGMALNVHVELDLDIPEGKQADMDSSFRKMVSKLVTDESDYVSAKEHAEACAEVITLTQRVSELGAKLSELGVENKMLSDKMFSNHTESGRRKKLTDEAVWKIRRFISRGKRDRWISSHMALSVSTVYRIRKNLAYMDVVDEPERNPVVVEVGMGIRE